MGARCPGAGAWRGRSRVAHCAAVFCLHCPPLLPACCLHVVAVAPLALQERGRQEAAAAGNSARSLQGSAAGKAAPPPPRRKFMTRKAQEQALLVRGLVAWVRKRKRTGAQLRAAASCC